MVETKMPVSFMSETWKEWQGQVVDGKFYLGQYLGGSDHSAVFLVERQENPRKAAIKLIPADPATYQLQLSRWEAARKLSHPHLMRLFECGRCQIGGNTLLYVVTEFASEDLSNVIPTRALSPEETRDTLKPVIEALTYLHDHGLVHGHLRLSNVMAVDEQLKISSDGLAKEGERRSSHRTTRIEDAPEAAGSALSPTQDIWSLGMLVVEVLTQNPPVREGVNPGEPLLPQTLTPPFSEIARNCLRRDPQIRWKLAHIAARLQPRPAVAVAPHPTRQPFNPRAWLVPAAVVVVALGLIVGAVKFFQRPEQPAVSTQAAEPPKTMTATAPPAAAPPPAAKKPAASPSPTSAPQQAALPPQTTASSGTTAPPGAAKPKPSALKPGAGRPAALPARDVIPASQSVQTSTSSAATTDAETLNLGTSIVHVEKPNVPQSASNTIQGTIKVVVKVDVDAGGNVTAANLDSPGSSKYFNNLSVQAARNWKFAPAAENPDAPKAWTIRFEYQQAGVHAYASKVNP
jgi:TonB family protein